MSATLTWNVAGPLTKTGTDNTAAWTDLKALFDTKLADPAFKWEVASSNVGTSPRQITLKRKDASAGRILLLAYDSIPGTYPLAIFGSSPVANSLFVAYFPAGNVDTPASLTTNASPVMGVDTGVVKCSMVSILSSVYSVLGVQWHYAENAEGLIAFLGSSTAGNYAFGAGDLVVDANDVAYPCTFGGSVGAISSFGASSTTLFQFSNARTEAGTATVGVRTNYGATDRQYFQAFAPSGSWGIQVLDSAALLADTSGQRVWFVPMLLCSNAQQPGTSPRGEGFPLKLRQIGFGPGTLAGPLTPYSTTGPVVQAICLTSLTGASTGSPWVTNFKL